MQGGLTFHAGVLWVGRHALTAEVASYDLDGRPLETSFKFRDERVGRSSVLGLDVDSDRRIWVADGAAGRVRCFTLFGVEVASVGDSEEDLARGVDKHGTIGTPCDVRVAGSDDDTVVVVASTGRRRHALQVMHVASGRSRSIAPLGEPESPFRRIHGIDLHENELCVCEAGARRIQVFEGEVTGRLVFRFAFDVPEALGVPEAVLAVGDGRFVVATAEEASGVHVFDASGRHLTQLAGDEARPRASFGDAAVDHPCALALERGASDRASRLCVLDADGERVQMFSLDGRSYGSVLSAGTR